MPRVRQRRRRPKTISRQGISGQRGINLIERVVLERSRWTPSGPNEIGIDGYIELFDPNSGRPLGLTVAVQSKVVEATGDSSTATFEYWCDANDIEYWLGGNTPIILVVSAPSSNVAYWVSIKDQFRSWTQTDSTRVTFAKDRQLFTKDSFRELAKIAAPTPGLFLAPTRRRETLQLNLVLLENFPRQIFIAVTDCRTYRDAWARLRKDNREVDAAWVLWEKKIFSFHDLGERPWVSICDEGTVEPLPAAEWSESDDADRQRLFVQLLNANLKAQLSPGVRYWPKEDCYAIVGRPRKIAYQSLKRSSPISVVSRFESVSQDGRRFEWFRHLGFRGQFRRFERRWYLEVTPTYRFTSDGQMLDRFHEERLKGIKRIEKNRAVLSGVLFWADYLQPKHTLFRSEDMILTFGKLATFSCDVGIDDRAWLAEDPDAAAEAEIEGQGLLLVGMNKEKKAMKVEFFQEPELEFGRGGTHVDIRYGLMRHGPLDIEETSAPTQLRVGVVGTEETIAAIRSWFERCRESVEAKKSKLVNLYPAFPGFSEDSPFHSSLVFHDRWCSAIRQRDIDIVLGHAHGNQVVHDTVALFLDCAEGLLEQGGPMVLVCVPPSDVLAAVDEPSTPPDLLEQELDEGSEPDVGKGPTLAFHDVLKGEGMRLGIPIQMVRPSTYTGVGTRKRSRRRRARSRPLQDEATRAWNIHTALYYKAGGVPWRLLRNASDLATLFVGVSFYRTVQGDRVLTSIAQVFNERGEGVIVKGSQAQIDKDDRQPQLSEDDAASLLQNAIQVYRREHRTTPARLVVHKTSRMTEGELRGFQATAESQKIDLVELVSVRRSLTRLFREGTYPPLRGTFLKLDDATGLLYLRGSVQFFETYPGMYVPRPLEFVIARGESPVEKLAQDMLSLSKLNWNNTQFDGGEPITVRAARRVGDILKCVPEGGFVQPSFRFYI